jgi:hypothetical protein
MEAMQRGGRDDGETTTLRSLVVLDVSISVN